MPQTQASNQSLAIALEIARRAKRKGVSIGTEMRPSKEDQEDQTPDLDTAKSIAAAIMAKDAPVDEPDELLPDDELALGELEHDAPVDSGELSPIAHDPDREMLREIMSRRSIPSLDT